MLPELSIGEIYLLILLAAIGVGGLGAGVFLWRRAAASRRWPWVMGTVVDNRVRAEVLPQENGGTYTRYYPEVAYEYTVEGRIYRSTRIRFGGLAFVYSTDRSEIETWLADRYPVGQQIPVYYNPRRPKEAVLEPGSSPAAMVLLAVGLIGLVGVVVLLTS